MTKMETSQPCTAALLERLAAAMPDLGALATISTDRIAGKESIRIEPHSLRAAPIFLVILEDATLCVLTIGNRMTTEIRSERAAGPDNSMLDEIEAFVVSVIRNGASEIVWRYGTEIVRSRGAITVAGKKVKVQWSTINLLKLLLAKREAYQYDAY